MIELTKELKEVREFYKEKYYDRNDPAHMIDHADEVYKNALKIVNASNMILDEEIIFYMCYTHDIFAGTDRNNHHLLAFEYVRNTSDKYLGKLTDMQIFLISEAVLKHRASSTMSTRSEYDTIMRLADKGKPDFKKILERSRLYTRARVPEDQVEIEVKKHIKEKYSRDGYAFNDYRYVNTYKDEIHEFWKEVDKYLEEG